MKDRFVRTLIADLDDKSISEQREQRKLKELTPRQAEVFEYLNLGKTTGEIAILMGLDAGTISHQKRYMRNKGYMWKVARKEPKNNEMEENP